MGWNYTANLSISTSTYNICIITDIVGIHNRIDSISVATCISYLRAHERCAFVNNDIVVGGLKFTVGSNHFPMNE